MKTRERAVIYSLLAGMLVLNLSFLLGKTGTPALAGYLTMLIEDLGPAETLTLVNGDDGKDIVLRNRGGHLAWGESPYNEGHSVAYVFIGKILGQLMDADSLRVERERLFEELEEVKNKYREEIEALGAHGQSLERGTEEEQQARQRYRAKVEEFRTWQQTAIARTGKLDAEHLERSYREMIEAVDVVADRVGIDTVDRFVPTDEEFEAESAEQAMLAIRIRPALRYPKKLDITDQLIEELSLELE